MKKIKSSKSYFTDGPKSKSLTWIKPKIVVEIQFTEWTDTNVMRHPVFLGLREDKNPKEVRKENG